MRYALSKTRPFFESAAHDFFEVRWIAAGGAALANLPIDFHELLAVLVDGTLDDLNLGNGNPMLGATCIISHAKPPRREDLFLRGFAGITTATQAINSEGVTR